MNAYNQHMQSIYRQMREDLVQVGFKELTTQEDVTETMDNLEGSALIVVNSVCGCAAGQARPAV
ncbi:BrxA/BrxB family bacilliredoxin, partial [Microvirga sp. 3-52]|nr:BrxA/BrxB family bacilliredoxin [Microvirga sp. 3-52]